MATCSVQDIADDAACFYAAVAGPGQFEALALTLLCRINQALDPMATCDVQDLMDDAKCFFGVAKGGEATALILQLLCEINTNIVNALPICGHGNPNTNVVVGTQCGQSYLDLDTDASFTWNGTAWV